MLTGIRKLNVVPLRLTALVLLARGDSNSVGCLFQQ